MPVPAGLALVDGDTGDVDRTLPVARGADRGPVEAAALGDVLLEQRGADLVALRPAP